jgi:lysophospholipase L1-like esterase
MADAPKILGTDSLRSAYPKLNMMVDLVNNFKSQVNEIVVEGDSSVEAAQARVDAEGNVFPTLKDRMDDRDEQLEKKASKEELNALGQLKLNGTYATLTDLQTAFPSGDMGLYLVTANGYVYRWDSAEWIQSVQFQSTGIAKKSITINEIEPIETGKNMFNKDDVGVGYLLPDGSLNGGSTYRTTHFIPAYAGIDYTSKYTRKLGVYDNAKTLIQVIDNSAAGNYTVTPAQDGFIRVSFYASVIDEMQVEQGVTSSATEPYYLKLQYEKSQVFENPLNGKTILNLGDSIAYGAYNNGIGYADLIASKNTMSVYDYSQSGATIADVTSVEPTRACIQHKLDDFMTENPSVTPEYILLEGGANDILYASLGTKTSGYEDTWTTTEFCGGLESIINTLKINYPSSKLVFVCVHNNYARDLTDQTTYYEKTVGILKKWSVPYVDIFREGGLNTWITIMRSTYTDTGTHPNELGYNLFYVPLIETKMKAI